MHTVTEAVRTRVPVVRTHRPNFRGVRKRVVVPEILKTLDPKTGKPKDIDFNRARFGIDADGTLWGNEPYNHEGWGIGVRNLLPHHESRPIEEDAIAAADGVLADVFEKRASFDDLKSKLFDALHHVLPQYKTAEELETAVAWHRDQYVLKAARDGKFGLLPGVLEFLRMLRERDWMVALTTANAAYQPTQLLKFFFGDEAEKLFPSEHRWFGRDLENEGVQLDGKRTFRNKRSPDIYRVMSRKWGVRSHEEELMRWVLVVDDREDVIVDAIRARALGAIWVHPDMWVDELLEEKQSKIEKQLGPRLKNRVVLAPSLELVRF